MVRASASTSGITYNAPRREEGEIEHAISTTTGTKNTSTNSGNDSGSITNINETTKIKGVNKSNN